jgi:phosphoglycerate dehydrogenase-like enzyme
VIARTGVGYDRVDVAAATELGIAVTITPNSNHEAVAEFALALLFAVAKSIVSNDRQVRQGRWPRELVAPLRRCTLGILGLGRIGRSTAVRAAALGMKVIATENAPDLEFARRNSIRLVDFETLLRDSDFLSLHCPLGDETRGLLNRDAFAKMKKGSVLINTARGKLVVEADLVEALKSRHLAGAGLDVYELEPPAASNPLFQLEQVVLSPHVAGTDHASSAQMSVDAAECIVALFRGDWPEGCVVNEELRGRWVQQ